MNQLVFSLLMGAPSGQGGGGIQQLVGFFPLIAIFGIFYFLIIRPQKKKQKETQRMLEELKKGDRVVTIGGIHGVIQTVREKSVIIKVDENCKLEFSRSAVASVDASGRSDSAESDG